MPTKKGTNFGVKKRAQCDTDRVSSVQTAEITGHFLLKTDTFIIYTQEQQCTVNNLLLQNEQQRFHQNQLVQEILSSRYFSEQTWAAKFWALKVIK